MILKMKKLIKKPIIVLILILLLTILMLYFFINKNNKLFNKNFNIGNNITNKSIQEIEEYILNISSYEATVSVTIESNKNTNKYVLEQKYKAPNLSKQIVLEPSNIAGIEIKYDGTNLTINNSNLNLQKVYENYEYLANNFLCLETFIEDYKRNKVSIQEENNEIILEASNENNNYAYHKKLFIDKNSGLPTKLLIENINNKTLVYILYNEIELNNLKEDDILAFKTIEPKAGLY